ncbi:hypothetical protein RJT34_33113 [Clitoria ternatea]|uniref:Uncharacterized protein n=1 Tax=Clitoria ternatea TaxID=43366 RepID=A0AAN9I2Y0_CLITE
MIACFSPCRLSGRKVRKALIEKLNDINTFFSISMYLLFIVLAILDGNRLDCLAGTYDLTCIKSRFS